MDAIDERKAALRAMLRDTRRALAPERAHAEAAATVLAVRGLLEASPPPALAGYLALRDELAVDALHTWWRARGGVLLLPRVVRAGELAWHALARDDALVIGAYGIREPPSTAPAMALPAGAVVVVPGVGFGADGRRLGQGGGFYDRLVGDVTTIGVGYACQRADDLPIAAHDRRVDGVVLGGEILRAPPARRRGGA